MNKKTLIVFDGLNLFIRSFSGLMRQGLSAPDGSGTWGVFGAVNVMANITSKFAKYCLPFAKFVRQNKLLILRAQKSWEKC